MQRRYIITYDFHSVDNNCICSVQNCFGNNDAKIFNKWGALWNYSFVSFVLIFGCFLQILPLQNFEYFILKQFCTEHRRVQTCINIMFKHSKISNFMMFAWISYGCEVNKLKIDTKNGNELIKWIKYSVKEKEERQFDSKS
jgi:hypothetical protein